MKARKAKLWSDILPEVLDSERLHIRVARPGDGQALNAAIADSYSSLAPWMPWVHPMPSLEESERVCRHAHARWLLNEDLMALLFRQIDGTLVGAAGLHSVDWNLRRYEIGYWGRTAYLGKGYVTEAVRALADHALSVLGANRVFARMDSLNQASCKLAERAGFQLEGILRNDATTIDGHLRDTRVYARISALAVRSGG